MSTQEIATNEVTAPMETESATDEAAEARHLIAGALHEQYGLVERLASKADGDYRAEGGSPWMMTVIVVLSGILSGIFFWQNSARVFSGVHPTLALVLALLVGLLPNEGAFFAWKQVRATRRNLTSQQLRATAAGIVFAVAGAVFGTLAMFVTGLARVPELLQNNEDWLVFVALGVPIVVQVVIYAYFSVHERSTVENYENARLSAMGFNAYVKAEKARMQAIIDGLHGALEEKLGDYGALTGVEQADAMLRGAPRRLLAFGRDLREAAGRNGDGDSPRPS